jgi:hypothetical protein
MKKFRSIVFMFLTWPLILNGFGFFLVPCHAQEETNVDNSSLMPKLLPDSQVRLEGASPDWVKTLIMAEVRIETATPEGTFAAATKVLDHYAEMGVNGLWIDPIYDRDNAHRNGYNNFGPQTIDPALTGTTHINRSFHEVKKFVDEAHRRNIRIFFDIIVWGTSKDSPLVKSHPEFYTRKNGKFVDAWGGYQFDWQSQALRRWYKNAAIRFIERTGADGFRVDLAPGTSGYFFKDIRDTLYAKGRKIIVISEMPSVERDVFDFEQVGVTGWTEVPDWTHRTHLAEQERKFGSDTAAAGGRAPEFFFRNNIVDVIRAGKGIGNAEMQAAGTGGTFRFYTSNLLDHDDATSFTKDNRVRFAYPAIFAPFIPVWWIGAEWNNPKETGRSVMYFNSIDWNTLPSNRSFYEDIKKYIRIRLSYPKIFQYFPESTRDANIAKLTAIEDGVPDPLQAYARFADGEAVLIVPNYGSNAAEFQIKPDYAALGLDPSSSYKVTNLMTGQVLTREAYPSTDDKTFIVQIGPNHLGIYLMDRR